MNASAKKPMNILLGQLMANGDCLYATTLARQIKHDHPDCRLTWAISSKCRHLLVNNPDVDEIWEISAIGGVLDDRATWFRFVDEAEKKRRLGCYDRVIYSQIWPGNFQNYDGTIRPSVLRAYGQPITVPVRSILRLTDEEQRRADDFAVQHGLIGCRRVLLFECAPKSGQSNISPAWAKEVAIRLLQLVPDAKIILTSSEKIDAGDERIIDASDLTIRENAGLLPYCSCFAGCGSGITVIATTLEQSPPDLPVVQFIAKDKSVYASFLEDFRYWKLGTEERFIETCTESAEDAANLLASVFLDGVAEAGRRFHQPPPRDFQFYCSLIGEYLLDAKRACDGARSVLTTAARFGWHTQLNDFIEKKLMPPLLELAQAGDSEAACCIARIQHSRSANHMPEGHRIGEYAVDAISGAVLPHPLRVRVDSGDFLRNLRLMATHTCGSISKQIQEKSVDCPFEKRGNLVGNANVDGNWTVRLSPESIDMLLPFPADVELQLIWDSVDEKATSWKWRHMPREVGRWCRGQLRNRFSFLFSPAPVPTARIPLVLVGWSSPPKADSIFEPGYLYVKPGYGCSPTIRAGLIVPAPSSFLYMISWNEKEILDLVDEFVFLDYPERMSEIELLRGVLRPGQRVSLIGNDGTRNLHEWEAANSKAAAEMSWPTISVVMPSFNQGRYLRQALDSVLEQNYPKLELIVLDPGSTDGSRAILDAYRDKIDRLIYEPDAGQSDALQKGFNVASGDILTWLCTDDMLEPRALFVAAEAFMKYGSDMVAGGCRRIDDEGNLLSNHHSALPFGECLRLDPIDILNIRDSWLRGNYFFQPEVFFTRDIWRRAGAFLWPSAFYAMDYELWLRMALAGATIAHIPAYLANSRVQSDQKTNLEHPERSPWLHQLHNFTLFYQRLFASMEQSARIPKETGAK